MKDDEETIVKNISIDYKTKQNLLQELPYQIWRKYCEFRVKYHLSRGTTWRVYGVNREIPIIGLKINLTEIKQRYGDGGFLLLEQIRESWIDRVYIGRNNIVIHVEREEKLK